MGTGVQGTWSWAWGHRTGGHGAGHGDRGHLAEWGHRAGHGDRGPGDTELGMGTQDWGTWGWAWGLGSRGHSAGHVDGGPGATQRPRAVCSPPGSGPATGTQRAGMGTCGRAWGPPAEGGRRAGDMWPAPGTPVTHQAWGHGARRGARSLPRGHPARCGDTAVDTWGCGHLRDPRPGMGTPLVGAGGTGSPSTWWDQRPRRSQGWERVPWTRDAGTVDGCPRCRLGKVSRVAWGSAGGPGARDGGKQGCPGVWDGWIPMEGYPGHEMGAQGCHGPRPKAPSSLIHRPGPQTPLSPPLGVRHPSPTPKLLGTRTLHAPCCLLRGHRAPQPLPRARTRRHPGDRGWGGSF